jgi:hypothetical protein
VVLEVKAALICGAAESMAPSFKARTPDEGCSLAKALEGLGAREGGFTERLMESLNGGVGGVGFTSSSQVSICYFPMFEL